MIYFWKSASTRFQGTIIFEIIALGFTSNSCNNVISSRGPILRARLFHPDIIWTILGEIDRMHQKYDIYTLVMAFWAPQVWMIFFIFPAWCGFAGRLIYGEGLNFLQDEPWDHWRLSYHHFVSWHRAARWWCSIFALSARVLSCSVMPYWFRAGLSWN